MKYEDRIVVFLDLLGFKNKINETIDENCNDNEKNIENIYKLNDLISNHLSIISNPSRVVTVFSDSIVISFKNNEESGVFFILEDIHLLIVDLLQNDFLIRGSIVSGKLIHDSKTVFGPALIKAYILESKFALYPRIIIEEKVIELGKQYHALHHNSEIEAKHLYDFIKNDEDGYYYIEYISNSQGEFGDPEYDYPIFLEKIEELIKKNIDNENKSIRDKYIWIAKKYNDVVVNIHKNNKTRSNLDEELIEFYEQIEIIDYKKNNYTLLNISDENFWYQIGDAHQLNGGIYKIVCVDENENIIPIWRLLGEDKDGILYIGKANSFLDRVINFKKSTDPKYKSAGHDFGKVYKSHSKLMDRFPYENLRALLIQNENPGQLEKQELEKYEHEFGELPPFNHVKQRIKGKK